MTWILLILLIANQNMVIWQVEGFSSEATCQVAAKKVVRDFGPDAAEGIRTACVPKS